VPAIPGQQHRAVYQHDSGYEAVRHPDGSARTVQRPSHPAVSVGSAVVTHSTRPSA
jgi:hypothetical protein